MLDENVKYESDMEVCKVRRHEGKVVSSVALALSIIKTAEVVH